MVQTTSDSTLGNNLGTNSTSSVSGGAEARKISDALKQVKQATSSVCDAVGTISSASSGIAKQKMEDGKQQITDLGVQTEAYLRQRPLMAVGLAFAAGIVAAKLIQSGPRDR